MKLHFIPSRCLGKVQLLYHLNHSICCHFFLFLKVLPGFKILSYNMLHSVLLKVCNDICGFWLKLIMYRKYKWILVIR